MRSKNSERRHNVPISHVHLKSSCHRCLLQSTTWSILPQPQSKWPIISIATSSCIYLYTYKILSYLWKTAWNRILKLPYFSALLLWSVVQLSWLSSLLLVKQFPIPTQWTGMKTQEISLVVLTGVLLVTKYAMMKPILKNAILITGIVVMSKMILVFVQIAFATLLDTWSMIHSSKTAQIQTKSTGT